MANELTEYVKANRPTGTFKPRPYYSEVGDFISFHISPEECYAHRVDDLMTVYLSKETHALIGCKIKGVKRIILNALERAGIKQAVVGQLSGMFFAGMALSEQRVDPRWRQRYDEVFEVTRNVPSPWSEEGEENDMDLQPANSGD